MRRASRVGVTASCLFLAGAGLIAVFPSPLDEQGHVGLGLLLRRLNTVGIFMQATAHPDDENNGLLVMLGRGQGVRTVLATATRGDGGQNEIGPELFDALGVLRTAELESVHRVDGAEQYFTRAVDFGYSFSVEETFDKWGRDEILGDYVRLIRMTRPDVIAAMPTAGMAGGLHHQASALLTKDAFRKAADPTAYPEQIREGLRPWQALKLYTTVGFGRNGPPIPPGVRSVAVVTEKYDPLLGTTYQELGSFARSMHKCQGMAQLLALPGMPQTFRYMLADTTIAGQLERDETSLFDGVDTSIESLSRYAPDVQPAALKEGLERIATHVREAQTRFERERMTATIAPLLSGLDAARSLRTALAGMGLSDTARYEIDARLATKEDQFEQALVAAAGLRFDALADDGVVVAGEPLKTTMIVANQGAQAVEVKRVDFEGLESLGPGCAGASLSGAGVFTCEADLRVPDGARLTGPYWTRRPDAARYEFDADAPFGLPFRPSPFQARVVVGIGGRDLTVTLPVVHRYQGNIFSGEKRMELTVVPRLAVRLSPEIAIIPLATREVVEDTGTPRGHVRVHREVRVTVTNGVRGPAEGQVTLDLPGRWRATPESAPLTFSREDEAQTVRFTIDLPAATPPGEYRMKAIVRTEGAAMDSGYQVIEYPHIQRRHVIQPASGAIKVIDVRTAAGLTVGYVMGVGDQVSQAIQQLGVKLEPIDAEQLAWGDLARYDAIVTGVRAYERREDLRAHNDRLLEYARQGGIVIVQYNKFEFNDAQYGPYPARVSSGRITDENAPVTLLVPDHPIFRFPNRIGEAAWKGWVQERGLYFLGEKDAHYADLVELTDPFENNRGAKRGALVEARIGRGRWIYLGLGLWRQLPAGTDGAYQLLANLLSLGKAPRAAAPVTQRGR